MSEWKEYKLGQLGVVITGKTPSKNNPEDWGDSMPFITPSDYKNYRKMASKSERCLSIEGINRLLNKIIPEKSILATCIGSDMGKIVMNAVPVITNQQINSIIPNKNIIDSDFLYYLLVEMYETLRMYGGDGTAIPILNKGDFENIRVEIPSLPEQRAIASVLSSLDDKIDLLHRENKTLEAMAETLFRQWFIEEAKDEWEDAKLGEVVTITYGKNLPIKKLLKSGYPVFGGNGQIGFYNKYLYVEPQVLVSCRGEASGKVNISLPRSFITNNSLILVRDKRKEITFEYLKYHSLNYDFTLHISGSAQPQITIDSLYDAAFLIPPVDLINKFTEIVRGCEEKRANNLKQIHTLEKLRDTLLPKLMSGEVRVKCEEEEMASCRR